MSQRGRRGNTPGRHDRPAFPQAPVTPRRRTRTLSGSPEQNRRRQAAVEHQRQLRVDRATHPARVADPRSHRPWPTVGSSSAVPRHHTNYIPGVTDGRSTARTQRSRNNSPTFNDGYMERALADVAHQPEPMRRGFHPQSVHDRRTLAVAHRIDAALDAEETDVRETTEALYNDHGVRATPQYEHQIRNSHRMERANNVRYSPFSPHDNLGQGRQDDGQDHYKDNGVRRPR
jgi:hypothetical protein